MNTNYIINGIYIIYTFFRQPIYAFFRQPIYAIYLVFSYKYIIIQVCSLIALANLKKVDLRREKRRDQPKLLCKLLLLSYLV